MKRLSRANRRDENEPQIVELLLNAGANVYRLDCPCDLLVGYAGKTFIVEIKMPDGTFTENQIKFYDVWKGSPPVILTTTDECLEFLRDNR